MAKLTDEMLKRIMPHAPKAARLAALPILNHVAYHYEIRTALRLRMWLATLALESGELKYQEEIASGAAYEGRRDLGNIEKGDGRRFKGRARIQNTGRDVYTAYTKYLKKSGHLPFVDFVSNPRRLAEEPYATDASGWFVNGYKNLNPLADANNFKAYQIKVNGRNKKTGLPNHWAERSEYYRRATMAIPGDFVLTLDEAQPMVLTTDGKEALEGTAGWPDFDPVDMVVKDNQETPNGLDDVSESSLSSADMTDEAQAVEAGKTASESLKTPAKAISETETVCKERPSTFMRWITAIKVFVGTMIAGVASYCGGSGIETKIADKAVENADRSLLAELLPIIIYTLLGIAAGVFLIWIASVFYDRSAARASRLNEKKIDAASDKDKNTVDFGS